MAEWNVLNAPHTRLSGLTFAQSTYHLHWTIHTSNVCCRTLIFNNLWDNSYFGSIKIIYKARIRWQRSNRSVDLRNPKSHIWLKIKWNHLLYISLIGSAITATLQKIWFHRFYYRAAPSFHFNAIYCLSILKIKIKPIELITNLIYILDLSIRLPINNRQSVQNEMAKQVTCVRMIYTLHMMVHLVPWPPI